MKTTIATIIILLLLAENHRVHGEGCWGLQPGGGWSAMLFNAQALITLNAVCWSLYWLFKGREQARVVVIAAGLLTAIAAVFAYMKVGWHMHTSMHYQGTENLPTFFLASGAAIILGGYRWWIAGRYSKSPAEDR